MRKAFWCSAGSATIMACGTLSAFASARQPAAAPQILPLAQIDLSFATVRFPDPAPEPHAGEPLAPVDFGQPRAVYLQWLDGRTRLRSDRSRIAFYPVRGSGFHVSGASRLHAGYQATGIALDNHAALRIEPRRSSAPTALSTGYDRSAPVALVGYDQPLTNRLTLGVDMGAMRGREVSVDAFAVSGTNAAGLRDDRLTALNPVVDLSLTYAF